MYQYYTNGEDVIGVRRLSDGACIPLDGGNRDYEEFLIWFAKGGEPLAPEQ